MTIALDAPNSVDCDLYIERQSRISGAWSPAGKAATGAASETATMLQAAARATTGVRVVNWAAGAPADGLTLTFSNVYAGTPPGAVAADGRAERRRLGRRS